MNPFEVFQEMAAEMAKVGLKVPPPIFEKMAGEVLSYDAEAKKLVVRFPVLEWYQNPLGYMQGGMIAAAIDNAVGPLSFLVSPPSVTVQFNTSYIRPVPPEAQWIEVTAVVTEQTRRQLFMTATVTNETGHTAAIAHVVQQVVGRDRGG